jgi:hypothetical protein
LAVKAFTNNVFLHPIRAVKILLRQALQNQDAGDPLWDGGKIPPALEPFTVGEFLPWKGTSFKVGKIIGGDFPMLILVPVDRTHGAKLKVMRTFRDIAAHDRKEQAAMAAAVTKATR